MLYLFLIFVFSLGLVIGSFLNSVIYRLQKGESIAYGRSHCPHCGHPLRWYDLIPLLSFIFLKGKCRYCHQKISLQYPLVELSTGLIFLSIILKFPVSNTQSLISDIFLFVISSFLIVIFISDFKYYLISDKILYPAIIVGFIYLVYNSFFVLHSLSFFLYSLIAAFFVALFFFSLCFFSKEKAMGFGDVEISLFLGFSLGFPNILVCIFFAFLLGAFVGVIMIVSKKKTMKSKLPFAPFLVISAFIALFFGNQIINFYLRFLS